MRKLETDDGVVDEALAKGLALVSILHRLLVADAGETDTLDDDANALVVEVGHDDLEALVLLADQVLDGDLDVLEGNVGGTAAPHTLAVHLAGGDATSAALNEKHGDAVHAGTAGANGGGEVVAPDTVGDPLLLTVDDIVLAVLRELSLACQVSNVATGIRLSDGEADALVSVKDSRHDPLDKFGLAELGHWRGSDAKAADEVPHEASTACARELIGEEHLMEEVPLLHGHALYTVLCKVCLIFHAQQASQVSALAHLLVDRVRNLLGLVPLGDVGHDFLLNPLSHFVAESGVSLVEVRGVILGTVVSSASNNRWASVLTDWYHAGSA